MKSFSVALKEVRNSKKIKKSYKTRRLTKAKEFFYRAEYFFQKVLDFYAIFREDKSSRKESTFTYRPCLDWTKALEMNSYISNTAAGQDDIYGAAQHQAAHTL